MPDKLFDILAMTDFAEPAKKEMPRKTHRRKTQCYELSTKYLYRRAFSETSLLDACEKFEFREGHAYHFITGGDVDSLSYLKAILRQQPLSYCLFSTWCMAAEDILQFEEWLRAGRIKHIDGYVCEIFPNSYRVEYQLLKDVFARTCGGGGESPCSKIIRKYMPASGRNSPSQSKHPPTSTPTHEPKTAASLSTTASTSFTGSFSTG